MPITVVVGGQFGSEGKGKVAHWLAREKQATVAIRVGGPNSGHTAVDKIGKSRIFKILPTAALLDDVICVLGAGSYLDVDILFQEMTDVGLSPDRLLIDPNAYVISDVHRQAEREWHLGEKIGSTQSGTGAAVIERIRRLSAAHLARNDDRLESLVTPCPVRAFLRQRLDRREEIIIEGTQGFGLSLLHSGYYPKATSRDTTAAAFVAEAGLSPLDVEDVVLVIRAFPIRVAGDSGLLPNEIDWDIVTREAGDDTPIIEYTSVTKKVRRVARFDAAIVREAIESNAPTTIVLNHLDYVDPTCRGANLLSDKLETMVVEIEEQIDRGINWIGLGPAELIKRLQPRVLRKTA